MSISLNVASKTDKGLVRTGNEDYLHVDSTNQVFGVCDGMGGHQAGEVASMTASETLEKVFAHFSTDITNDPALMPSQLLPPKGDLLLRGIRLANRAIFNYASSNPDLTGMGTTIVAMAFEDDLATIAHVGDSRAYRLDEKELTPLTRDHSWVAELQQQQNLSEREASQVVGKNVITRALGVRETVQVDVKSTRVKPGELFLLCSDGLCGFADDDEIFDVATKNRNNLEKMADQLVQMANDRGGSDNVSVVIVQVGETKSSDKPEIDVFTEDEESPEALQAEDAWLAKLAELKAQEAEQGRRGSTQSRSGPNNLLLLLIFVVFIAIAALIILSQID